MTALDNYVAPASLEQAVEQLQELGEVTILAGCAASSARMARSASAP